ncbi:MAG: right-handed parallel beta-helix repeat-containing protein [Clostridia bacterium]|nr:right-handed parallel beta-helix repeat-containing protein [Clostridia bacterium]
MNFSEFWQGDVMSSFACAMKYLKDNPGTTLTVEPGTYILTDERACRAQRAVMSGEYGDVPQRVMFSPKYEYTRGISLAGQKGSRIIAYGVKLLVDGFMEPLSVVDCEDVEICGLTIDHLRKPYSRGIVTEVSPPDAEGMCVCTAELDGDCPIELGTPLNTRHGFFDVSNDRMHRPQVRNAKYVDPHRITMLIPHGAGIKVGFEYYNVHTGHSRPAILIERAKNVLIKDVTIHSQPGMGIVGNRSEEVTLSGLSVIPSPGHHWATNSDATHFTSMKGLLRYENCRFDGQGDDSANIHAYFQDIIARESDRICTIRENTPDGTHAQSLDYPDPGDILELTELDTLRTVDSFRVTEAYPNPEEWCCRVVLDHPLPENTERLVLADVTRLPRLEMVGCYCEKHFARGFLIKSREVLIEGNVFRNIPLAGIEVAAESYWYEGVSPANVVIRRNRIVDCGIGILVKADCRDPKGQSIRNVTISDNYIDCPSADHGIYAQNVDGLLLERNDISVGGEAIVCKDCINVSLPITQEYGR